MKTNTGFDFLAPIYDALARLVFGETIVDSQTWFLNRVLPDVNVLILGGGTGWLLEELVKRNPSCTVWYVEASSRMMEKTRLRKLSSTITFIQGTETDIPSHIKFEVVITNFYLDLFSEKMLRNVIQQITNQSTPAAQWIVTDFINENWWNRLMLKSMYLFFRMVCRIEATVLPNWTHQLNYHGWREIDSKVWYRGFIKSSIFQHEKDSII